MSWPASLTVGVLTALLAGALAGVVANLSVGWYRITSFEGAAGYWVVMMTLVGAVAGGIIGIAISRFLPDPTFLKALGAALLTVLVLTGAIGGTARLLADVPPRLAGHTLVLNIELRWPTGRSPTDLADTTEWAVRLSALSGSVARTSRDGPLWREDARLEEGRWIVPGVVDVFTSRGKRLITFSPDSLVGEGFMVPLPGRPGTTHTAWSEWLPTSRTSSDGFQFRFRVVPDHEPHRIERAGRFEIAAVGSNYGLYRYGNAPLQWSSGARFAIRHDGHPLTLADPDAGGAVELADAVAVVGGDTTALVVQVNAPYGEGPYLLVAPVGDSVRVTSIAIGGTGIRAAPITADSAAYAAARERVVLTGRVDWQTFATPGAYRFRDAILDTRTLTVRRFDTGNLGDVIERIPPLGISPDGLSLVRLAWAGDGERTALHVVDLAGGDPATVPVDRSVMRYADIDQISPAWLAHYFEWQRDAAGRDVLVARRGVTPLPHRGVITLDGSGYREYRISPAGEGLRPAFEEFLVAEFQAVRTDVADPAAFAHELTIGDALVHVSYRAEDGHVGAWMDRGTDTRVVATIAERFDAALASGRYDRFFVP